MKFKMDIHSSICSDCDLVPVRSSFSTLGCGPDTPTYGVL